MSGWRLCEDECTGQFSLPVLKCYASQNNIAVTDLQLLQKEGGWPTSTIFDTHEKWWDLLSTGLQHEDHLLIQMNQLKGANFAIYSCQYKRRFPDFRSCIYYSQRLCGSCTMPSNWHTTHDMPTNRCTQGKDNCVQCSVRISFVTVTENVSSISNSEVIQELRTHTLWLQLHTCTLSQGLKNGWKIFKYSSIFWVVAVNLLYFSSCPLRLSLGNRSNSCHMLSLEKLWLVYCIFWRAHMVYVGWVQYLVN